MTHAVLLGDSIFDNAAYVRGGPDVIRQLRAVLPKGWQATLCAVDGDMTEDVLRQLRQVPKGASHFIISVGGNDALQHIGILEEKAATIAGALGRLAGLIAVFERSYGAMLDEVLRRGLPTAVCTIYDPRFPDPTLQRLAVTALALFNDCITRSASTRGLPVIELRSVCDSDDDYANPIEPSSQGGAKIAAAITGLLAEHDFSKRRTGLFVR
jgi:hypothetical protein